MIDLGELTRGDRADLDIDNLTTDGTTPAEFQGADRLVWTARAQYGRAILITKDSTDGAAQLAVLLGGDSATVKLYPADFSAITAFAAIPFVWDLEYFPDGVAANASTIAKGVGTISPDVTGNPVAPVAALGGSRVCSPWATSADALAPCSSGVDTRELDLAMGIASDVLYEFTNRKYRGVCVDEVWPNAQWRGVDGAPRWWAVAGGLPYRRWGYCSCDRSAEYGCSSVPQIRLPGYPVDPASIVVTLDGEVFTDWELRDGRKLVRTDGSGWPCCQKLPLVAGVGNWSVRYNYGAAPPAAGARYAAILGCELYNAWYPSQDRPCRLPKRITNISRQGVTIGAIVDPLDLFEKGKTGIPMIDMWIASDRFGDRGATTFLDPSSGRGRKVTRTR